MTATDMKTDAARAALDDLTTPPPGIVFSIDRAATAAIEKATHRGVTAQTVARAVVEDVEPLIIKDVLDRLLRGATDVRVEWGTEFLHDNGQPPEVIDQTNEKIAHLSLKGIRMALANKGRRQGWTESFAGVADARTVSRQVVTLRDGSTFTSPWKPADE